MSCVITKICGPAASNLAGLGKEIWDIFGPGDASWTDLEADAIGTQIGMSCGDEDDCWDECRSAHAEGRLPPGR